MSGAKLKKNRSDVFQLQGAVNGGVNNNSISEHFQRLL
jgi:hypothetical protein